MPIQTSIHLRDLSNEEFDGRDRIVMRCAFDCQNELGRLFEESVYEKDLASRLRAEGFQNVHTQVAIVISHLNYQKVLYSDLVADDALYELKTVKALLAEHDAQILTYAMLFHVRHAKLLNFRSERVDGRLRYCPLSTGDRQKFEIQSECWNPISDQCGRLWELVLVLLNDWGSHLEVTLYEEALIHFFGGDAKCLARIPVVRNGIQLGYQSFLLHTDSAAFSITAFPGDISDLKSHYMRLIGRTSLRALQWINFNRSTIQFITIENPDRLPLRHSPAPHSFAINP